MKPARIVHPALTLARTGLVLAVLVIGLGAWTRLVDAGLGCPDWPGCYGQLIVPTTESQLARAAELFPGHTVDASKGWPEMIHRYAATALGFVILLLAIQAWRCRHITDYPQKLSHILLGLVILQGMFGMWTVTLKLWPQVVTLHLLGGMTTLSLLYILYLRLDRLHQRLADNYGWSEMRFENLLQEHNPKEWFLLWKLRHWSVMALAVLAVQIALGGWTSANYAAFACPDFPQCQGQWVPDIDIEQGFNLNQRVGPDYLGGQLDGAARTAIHYTHRVGALATFILVGGLALYMMRRPLSLSLQHRALMLFVALIFQLFLGIANVLLFFPLTLAVMHNLGAAFLLLSLCNLLWYLYALHPPLPFGGVIHHA